MTFLLKVLEFGLKLLKLEFALAASLLRYSPHRFKTRLSQNARRCRRNMDRGQAGRHFYEYANGDGSSAPKYRHRAALRLFNPGDQSDKRTAALIEESAKARAGSPPRARLVILQLIHG